MKSKYAIADEGEKLRPEPSLIVLAEALAGLAGGLAGDAPGDDGEVVGQSGEAAGEGAAADAGEEVELSISLQVSG